MKIRTDFVTNSSSSSFVVEVSVRDTEGNNYSVSIPPYDPDGFCNGDLKCDIDSIINAESVEALMDLLANSADCGYQGEYIEETEYDGQTRDAMNKFAEQVKNGITDLSQIESIKLQRKWYAWGEYASWIWFDYYEGGWEKIRYLAEAVQRSTGEEKEEVKRYLRYLLSHFTGEISMDRKRLFPSGFLNLDPPKRIVWTKFADSIEEFAQRLLDEAMPRSDYAEETVIIDKQTNQIVQKAEYILLDECTDHENQKDEDMDLEVDLDLMEKCIKKHMIISSLELEEDVTTLSCEERDRLYMDTMISYIEELELGIDVATLEFEELEKIYMKYFM